VGYLRLNIHRTFFNLTSFGQRQSWKMAQNIPSTFETFLLLGDEKKYDINTPFAKADVTIIVNIANARFADPCLSSTGLQFRRT
jgi:hypothetical protein